MFYKFKTIVIKLDLKMKLHILTIAIIFGLSACVQVPQSPMEVAARKAAGAELTAKQCAGYAGGYEAVKRLRDDANKNMAIAKQLGATDEVIDSAKQTVRTGFDLMVAFTNKSEACNSTVGSLAWADG